MKGKRTRELVAVALLAAFWLQGCEALELGVRGLEEKVETGHRRDNSFPGYEPSRQKSLADTCLWVTALEFPEGYDWRPDTLRGDVATNIVLFLNGRRYLTIDASPSSPVDPAHFHLIGNDLISFKPAGGITQITINGSPAFVIDGEEIIRGFVKDGDDVWTLGDRRFSDGFCLRRNGNVVFERPTGRVEGEMGDWQEDGQGALFWHKEKLCFFYSEELGGTRSWHLVQGSGDTPVPSTNTIVDAYFRNGLLCTLSYDPTTKVLHVREGGDSWSTKAEKWEADPAYSMFIREHKPELLVQSQGKWLGTIPTATLWRKEGLMRMLPSGVTFISNGSKTATVSFSERDYDLYISRGELSYGYSDCYIPGLSCILFREDVYSAINPREGDPFVSLAGVPFCHFHLNGYLAGVYMTINKR